MDGFNIGAIITASCAGIAAIIGALRLQKNTAKAQVKDKPEEDEDHALPPVPSTFDPDEVLGFLREVREDNVSLRAELKSANIKIGAQQQQMDEMGGELKSALKIQDAMMRWIPRIWASWNKEPTPPLPDGEDLVTLQEFIPRGAG